MIKTHLLTTSQTTGNTVDLGEFDSRFDEAVDTFISCFRDYWKQLQNEGHTLNSFSEKKKKV